MINSCRSFFSYYFLLQILFNILSPGFCFASNDVYGNEYLQLRKNEISAFAKDLFLQKEYYRAITEALRYLSLSPDGSKAEEMTKLIGDAYLMSHKWKDSLHSYHEFQVRYPHADSVNEVLFLSALATLQIKDNYEAEKIFDNIINRLLPSWRAEALRWKIVLLINNGMMSDATGLLEHDKYLPLIKDNYAEIMNIINDKKKRGRKSPVVAGFLSAIVPGSGQLYDGRYKDAFSSFILNALFIAGAYTAFKHDNYALGGAVTLFEMGWYTGNINGAVSAAYKYNRSIDDDVTRRLIKLLGLNSVRLNSGTDFSAVFELPS